MATAHNLETNHACILQPGNGAGILHNRQRKKVLIYMKHFCIKLLEMTTTGICLKLHSVSIVCIVLK